MKQAGYFRAVLFLLALSLLVSCEDLTGVIGRDIQKFTAKSLRVISPNGGETFLPTSVCAIRWEGTLTGNVRIELLAGSETVTISDSAPNNGTFDWVIPSGQTLTDNYKIRITLLSDPAVSDESDNSFRISTFFIQSPNGGERYWKNAPCIIRWSSVAAGNLKIEYVLGHQSFEIASGVPIANNQYSWSAAALAGLPDSDGYRIRITSLNEPDCWDDSDGSFTIDGSAPSGLAATDGSRASVDLGWSDSNAAGVTGYRIFRRGSPDEQFQAIGETTGTAYQDLTALPFKVYEYRVQAFCDLTDPPQESAPTASDDGHCHDGAVYVSTLGSDGNIGSPAAPKVTLQAAIDSVDSGAEVRVAGGSFPVSAPVAAKEGVSLHGGYSASFSSRSVLEYPATIVAGAGMAAALTCIGETITEATVIDGFTIHGSGAANSAAVLISGGARPILRNSRLFNNGPANLRGLHITRNYGEPVSRPLVYNNLIVLQADAGSTATLEGIRSEEYSEPDLANNTVYCANGGAGGSAYCIFLRYSTPKIRNNILFTNGVGSCYGVAEALGTTSNPAALLNNCIFNCPTALYVDTQAGTLRYRTRIEEVNDYTKTTNWNQRPSSGNVDSDPALDPVSLEPTADSSYLVVRGGLDLSGEGITHDRAGAARTAPWSMGAYEEDVLGVSPDPPTGVSASDGAYPDRVRIDWTSTGSASYRVYRSLLPDSGYAAVGDTSETSYDDQTATGWTVYYYRVSSLFLSGAEGAMSEPDSGYLVDAIYVHPDGEDAALGSPSAPKQTLPAGLETATAGQEVRVAQGTHTVSDRVDMKADVFVRGGYASDWSDRDPAAYPTILTDTRNLHDSTSMLFFGSGLTETSGIEGFTIIGPEQTSSPRQNRVIRVEYGSPVISRNEIVARGGCAIYCALGAAPRIEANTIVQTVGRDVVWGSASSPLILNNVIVNKGFENPMSGIRLNGGAPLIYGNTINGGGKGSGTTARAVYLLNGSTPLLRNNILFTNAVGQCHGIFEDDAASDPLAVQNNCIFDCPTALYRDSTPAVNLTSIADVNDYTKTTQDAAKPSDGNVTASGLADMHFQDAAGEDYRLTASSPLDVREGGLDLGDAFATDRNRNPRAAPWSVGAYEY